MKLYSARAFFLCIVLALISCEQSSAAEDTITIFINNKIKEVKNAEDLPDFYRYKKKYLLDKDNKPTLDYIIVPIRTIKIYYIGKNGEYVENLEDAVITIKELYDEDGNCLLNMRSVPKKAN